MKLRSGKTYYFKEYEIKKEIFRSLLIVAKYIHRPVVYVVKPIKKAIILQVVENVI